MPIDKSEMVGKNDYECAGCGAILKKGEVCLKCHPEVINYV
jgi:hypothetical protein